MTEPPLTDYPTITAQQDVAQRERFSFAAILPIAHRSSIFRSPSSSI
jgi:hypothetical protein